MWQAFGKHAAIAFGAGAGRAAMNHGIEHFFSGSGRAAKLPGRKWKTVSGVPIYRDEWGDFVVIVDRDNEDGWYYTDDPRDAVGTAKVMAKGRSAQGRAAQGRRAATITHRYKIIRKQRGLPGSSEKVGTIKLSAALSDAKVRAAIRKNVGSEWSIITHESVTPGRRADDAEYVKWLNTSKKLNAQVDATSAAMQQFPTGAMGLTPDAVKFSVEFKAADAAFQRAFRMLQDFNKNSPKAFKRRASVERRARRWGSSAQGRRARPRPTHRPHGLPPASTFRQYSTVLDTLAKRGKRKLAVSRAWKDTVGLVVYRPSGRNQGFSIGQTKRGNGYRGGIGPFNSTYEAAMSIWHMEQSKVRGLGNKRIPRSPSNQGRRAAPTTKQRKSMGQKLQALPWNQASALYKRNHPKYKGIGGYPMNTKQRASGARAYAISSYNAGKLTKKDVEIIFRRTGRKYPSMPKFDGMVCQKTRKNAKRRKCSSRTSR